MLTLTKASVETKLILKWGLISIIALFVLFFTFKGILFVKEILFPSPPPKPTLVYGKLSKPIFPQGLTNNFTYSINTIPGTLPVFEPTYKVYRIQYNPPDLLALQRAQKMVGALGFKTTPYQVSSQIYEWTSNVPSQKHLRMNIVYFSFDLTASLSSDPDIVSARSLPTQRDASNIVKDSLDSMGLYYPDIDDTKTKTAFFKFNNNSFSPASSFSQAQIIKVDLFQKDLGDIPILYEKPDTSSMDFIVAGGAEGGQIVGAQFTHQTPSTDFATYPVKTANEAFEELKSGKGYIASYFGDSKNISIRNAFIAYFMGNEIQNFLTPIIVFQGDDGFYAYVSAIRDEWTSK